MYEHHYKREEFKPIAEHVLQKNESRMKPSAQQPSDIRKCQHNELRRERMTCSQKLLMMTYDSVAAFKIGEMDPEFKREN